MKVYTYKKGYFGSYLMMGCDNLDELTHLFAEVRRAFEILPLEDIKEVPKQYHILPQMLKYFEEHGTGYFTKLYSSDDLDLIITGHKFAKFHPFVSRQKKIEQLLASDEN